MDFFPPFLSFCKFLFSKFSEQSWWLISNDIGCCFGKKEE